MGNSDSQVQHDKPMHMDPHHGKPMHMEHYADPQMEEFSTREHNSGINVKMILVRLIKYIVEGSAVALATYLITKKSKVSAQDILMIAITAAAVFAILDLFAPSVGMASRQGAGFGLGASLVGFGGVTLPGIPPGTA